MLAGDDKDLRAKAIDAANKPYTPPPAPPSTPSPKSFSAPSSFGSMAAAPIASTPMAAAGAAFGGSFEPVEVKMVNGKPAPQQPDFPEI
jgi:hypothetical protein